MRDMGPVPFATAALSESGEHVVRVVVPPYRAPEAKRIPVVAKVYAFDAVRDRFSLTSRIDFGPARPSEFVFLSNGGDYLVTANTGHWQGGDCLGLRIYDVRRRVLIRKLAMSDLLTPEQIRGLPKTGSQTGWFGEGFLRGERFVVRGPGFASLNTGSYTMMKGSTTSPYDRVISLRDGKVLRGNS